MFKSSNLEIKGLMTFGPNTKDKAETRVVFQIAISKDQINADYNKGLTELSMGMSEIICCHRRRVYDGALRYGLVWV